MIPVQQILDRKKKSYNVIQPTALVIDALAISSWEFSVKEIIAAT
jgi:hypothetical protein